MYLLEAGNIARTCQINCFKENFKISNIQIFIVLSGLKCEKLANNTFGTLFLAFYFAHFLEELFEHTFFRLVLKLNKECFTGFETCLVLYEKTLKIRMF